MKIMRNFFNKDELEKLVSSIKRESGVDILKSEGDTVSGLYRNLHHECDSLQKFMLDERLINLARDMLGSDVYIWRSTFWNLRTGERGQNYHQDIWPWFDIWPDKEYSLNSQSDVCSVWFPLEYCDEGNGVNRGLASEKVLLDRSLLNNHAFQSQMEDLIPAIAMSPGDIMIFDEYSIHGPGLKNALRKKSAVIFRYLSVRRKIHNRNELLLKVDKTGSVVDAKYCKQKDVSILEKLKRKLLNIK